MDRIPYGTAGPQVPPRGGGLPIDFNMNMASNYWGGNKRIGAPLGVMSRDVDSYQHDDTNSKANDKKKKTTTTTTTASSSIATSSSKPKQRKARKQVKKSPAKKEEKAKIINQNI
uniref:Uncharacterized protein n=1 Tax=Caenorhabditis japonica TaxID=281687 RepID=A0A8R1ERC4_CAEJA